MIITSIRTYSPILASFSLFPWYIPWGFFSLNYYSLELLIHLMLSVVPLELFLDSLELLIHLMLTVVPLELFLEPFALAAQKIFVCFHSDSEYNTTPTRLLFLANSTLFLPRSVIKIGRRHLK